MDAPHIALDYRESAYLEAVAAGAVDDRATLYAIKVRDGEIVAGPYVRAACKRHLDDLVSGHERSLRWDLGLAQRAVGFFRAVCTVAVEESDENGEVRNRILPFELQLWQSFIVGALFGWLRKGKRRFRRAYVEVAKGSGKALAIDTQIPTPDGWRLMGDLRVGDQVFDDAGVPCRVTAITGTMVGRPCFEVVFDDGARIVADADHLWLTEQRRRPGTRPGHVLKGVPKAQWGSWRFGLRSTAQIAATLRYRNGQYQSANHSVPLCGALQFEARSLSIPPYTLGVWLGDGDSDSARITVSVDDWEIVEAIADEGVPLLEQARHSPSIGRVSLSEGRGHFGHAKFAADVVTASLACKEFTALDVARRAGRDRDRVADFIRSSSLFDQVSPARGIGHGGGKIGARWRLRPDKRAVARAVAVAQDPIGLRLRALGLLRNKHVPPEYLRGSLQQRTALLQGLMDSDGSIDKRGACEFSVMNERLARDVYELVCSLGMKCFISEARAKLYGRDVGARWRVAFHPPASFPVFRLRRKRARQVDRHDRRRLAGDRRIVECRPVASVPVKCISVDSPSRMYLCGRQMVPTHNSPMAAGIGHYMLAGQRKSDAEVYSAASALDQAEIAFRHAVSMWEMSPALRRRLQPRGEKKVLQLSFINPHTKRPAGFFRPISAEKKGKSGPKVYCALIDEVHEHVDNSVIEMMRAGTKGNQEALIFEITNSGFDKRTVCGQEHDTSVKIVTGQEHNDAWFVFIASLDPSDEPFEDEACWIKANPNLGVSIHPDYIREQVQEAKVLPSKEGLVRRLNFCQWTGSDKEAIPRELWVKAERPVDAEALTEAGYRCFGGLDLSRTTDLTAFTLTWVPIEIKDQQRFVSRTWFWTPKDTIAQRAKKDRAPYHLWAADGYLEAVPGKILKFGWIADALLSICARYQPTLIGADEYGLKQLLEKLDEMGQTLPCVVHPQGFNRRVVGDRPELEGTGAEDIILWMPDSINKLEAALLEERITVEVNPVMRMCSQGVVFTQNRSGHRMFDKDKATTRIDGMVSLAMSIGVATCAVPEKAYQMIIV